MRIRHVVVAAAALAVLAPPAAAQEPTFGGGSLPQISVPRTYSPTVSATVQPRGAQIAVRFDTSLVCGRDNYNVSGRRTVAWDGTSFSASRTPVISLGQGRVNVTWRLSGTVSGEVATGTLRIQGVRRAGGRRTRCAAKRDRAFRAHLVKAPAGPAAAPQAAHQYFGATDGLGGGLPAGVVVRVSSDGSRVGARWTAAAPCGRGPAEVLYNFTPSTAVSSTGSFSRSERFRQSFSNALVRYRVSFGGQFRSDGATGTLRVRARIYDRRGRTLLTTCDSGARSWTATPD
jgi:hypothetical protein